MITAISKNPRDSRGLTRASAQESPPKDDRHLSILRLVANHKQRELRDHDEATVQSRYQATPKCRRLQRAALRARAQVEAAEARRRRRS
jgi:hypothetical protein